MRLGSRQVTRKNFLALISVGTGGLASLAVGIPIIGFVASPLIQKERQAWRDVGAVDSFRVGSTVKVDLRYADQLPWAGSTAYTSAWLRRISQDSFLCYANTCPHLGCPVSWLQTPEIFLCPCHGSVFNADGTVAGGPSPRPLYTYPCRVRNGRVEVKTEPLPLVNFTAGW
ncbi:MAG: Rieske 2Fe-2S domain-containing protein [Chloroflexi bacterium]|nr:Rieske 2Fe-2S domain-containing protein [Chloroflexota bacterium]